MNKNQYITKHEFVDMLTSFSGICKEELLQTGVIESGDLFLETGEHEPVDLLLQKEERKKYDSFENDEEIERRHAARILHNYIRIVLQIKDESDITKAYLLKDLFDCRVCANHIAQVYLKGIMKEVNIDGLIIFDVYGKVTEDDVKYCFDVISALKNS